MSGIIGKLVKGLFQNPLAAEFGVEDAEHIRAHHRILESNPFLKSAYSRWYQECLPAVQETERLQGTLLEVGCGVGFLERTIPGLLKTDSVPNPYAARIVDAMNLGFAPGSLRAIFAIQVFHHLSSPTKFLEQAETALQPGGRLVLVDANNSFPQRILCRLLDHYEYFDETVPEWETPSAGKMTGANLAMAWMVFVRDRDKFQARFPNLRIKSIRYHTVAAYILSGGMTYRPFLPSVLLPVLNLFERMTRPFGRLISSGMTIDIEKCE